MRQKLLKISKIIGITIVSIIFLLAATIGIVFQFVLTPEKITPKVVNALNENLNAELHIDAIELTFFKTFPNFKLELKNGYLLKKMVTDSELSAIQLHDTVISFDYGVVSVNPIAFIGNSIEVNKFSFENPNIYGFVNEQGEVNWSILKVEEKIDSLPEAPSEEKKFDASINIEEISIIDGNLIFDDRYSENYVTVEGFDLMLSALYNEKKHRT